MRLSVLAFPDENFLGLMLTVSFFILAHSRMCLISSVALESSGTRVVKSSANLQYQCAWAAGQL